MDAEKMRQQIIRRGKNGQSSTAGNNNDYGTNVSVNVGGNGITENNANSTTQQRNTNTNSVANAATAIPILRIHKAQSDDVESQQQQDSESDQREQNHETASDNIQQPADTACWNRFKQWIHCFCVVTFDLELGQTIEVIYPGDAQISPSERSDLCYLAFPDSNCCTLSSALDNNNRKSTNGSGVRTNGINGLGAAMKRTTLEGSPSDCAHHFRIRRTKPTDEAADLFSDAIAQRLPPTLRPDEHFFYGFAHFRRQRDPTLPRGYFQKSIVLVSHLPFVALFSRVLSEIALAYFVNGESAIETACRQIGQHWPSPMPGGDRLLSLPLFGLHFCCSIPANDSFTPDDESESSPVEQTLFEPKYALFPKRQSVGNENLEQQIPQQYEALNNADNNVFADDSTDKTSENFEVIDYLHCNIVHLGAVHELDQQFHGGIKRVLPHLHLLWELLLLGEPLLLLAPSPALSSTLVHSLISLIAPLRYNGDFRPYFTIHDSDFNEICSKQNCLVNSCILGVTNPFFLKALSHWPHILTLNATKQPLLRRERSESRLLRQLRSQPAAQFVLASLKRSGTATKDLDNAQFDYENDDRENGVEEGGQQKMIKRLTDRAQLEQQHQRSGGGFLCAHKQFLQADKTLPRKLLRTPSDSGSQWSALRWHFAELTQSFMSPLESYIATLMPLRRHLCPFQPVPQMRPFSLEQFLSSLRHFGFCGVRGDWQGLYRQFVTRSPNFIGWLRQRQRDIEYRLRLEHLDVICSANFSPTTLGPKSQVEIVDLVLKLTNRLTELDDEEFAASSARSNGSRRSSNNSSSRSCSPRNKIQQQNKGSPMIRDSPRRLQRVQLQQQFGRILSAVDEDLKLVLLSNPAFHRAAEHWMHQQQQQQGN